MLYNLNGIENIGSLSRDVEVANLQSISCIYRWGLTSITCHDDAYFLNETREREHVLRVLGSLITNNDMYNEVKCRICDCHLGNETAKLSTVICNLIWKY